jgi:hypothetical protein
VVADCKPDSSTNRRRFPCPKVRLVLGIVASTTVMRDQSISINVYLRGLLSSALCLHPPIRPWLLAPPPFLQFHWRNTQRGKGDGQDEKTGKRGQRGGLGSIPCRRHWCTYRNRLANPPRRTSGSTRRSRSRLWKIRRCCNNLGSPNQRPLLHFQR